jgi:hypothetical protein
MLTAVDESKVSGVFVMHCHSHSPTSLPALCSRKYSLFKLTPTRTYPLSLLHSCSILCLNRTYSDDPELRHFMKHRAAIPDDPIPEDFQFQLGTMAFAGECCT